MHGESPRDRAVRALDRAVAIPREAADRVLDAAQLTAERDSTERRGRRQVRPDGDLQHEVTGPFQRVDDELLLDVIDRQVPALDERTALDLDAIRGVHRSGARFDLEFEGTDARRGE